MAVAETLEVKELDRIEEALVALLKQIVRADRSRPAPTIADLRPREVADMLKASRLSINAGQIEREPVRTACAMGIELLGRRLHEMGEDMEAVHDRVVKRGGRRRNYWSGIIDKWWDGIGDWTA